MLNPLEIARLVKACAEAGVQELKLGELHVLFKADQKADDFLVAQTPEPTKKRRKRSSKTEAFDVVEDQMDLPFDETDEIRMKEDQMDLLRIENPAEYERLLAMGELANGEGAGH